MKIIPLKQTGYPGKGTFVTTPFPIEMWSGRDEGGRKSEFNVFTDDFRLKSKQHPGSSILAN